MQTSMEKKYVLWLFLLWQSKLNKYIVFARSKRQCKQFTRLCFVAYFWLIFLNICLFDGISVFVISIQKWKSAFYSLFSRVEFENQNDSWILWLNEWNSLMNVNTPHVHQLLCTIVTEQSQNEYTISNRNGYNECQTNVSYPFRWESIEHLSAMPKKNSTHKRIWWLFFMLWM